MKDYQKPHDSIDYIRENYPKITLEQVEELIKAGVMRRYRKLKKPRTMYVNQDNGAVLYHNAFKGKMEMVYYFIAPEHPAEIAYQQKLAEKQSKQQCPPKK